MSNDPFRQFAAQRGGSALEAFMQRPASAELAQMFTAGRVTKEELVALVYQPRRSSEVTNRPSGTATDGVRELAEQFRKDGWTEFADELAAIVKEGDAILQG